MQTSICKKLVFFVQYLKLSSTSILRIPYEGNVKTKRKITITKFNEALNSIQKLCY